MFLGQFFFLVNSIYKYIYFFSSLRDSPFEAGARK